MITNLLFAVKKENNVQSQVGPITILVISFFQKEFLENISKKNVDQNPKHNPPPPLQIFYEFMITSQVIFKSIKGLDNSFLKDI